MQLLHFIIKLSVIYFVGFPSIAAATDLDFSLIPHRAIYSMSLIKIPDNRGLSDVRGVMTYEFKDQCDAWTIESTVYLYLQYANQPAIVNIRSMVTWESKDGLEFNFRSKDVSNGKLTEEINGSAVMYRNGLGGLVKYTDPSVRKVLLPPGTLFPTAHIQTLIKHASGGGKHLTKNIFDGATLDNPYEVSGVIVAILDQKNVAPALPKALAKIHSFKIRMAYFPVKSKNPIPDIELDIAMQADGIVSQAVQEFGDYSIKAKLNQIDLIEKARC
ncbi:cell envelope integrity EipB family protein [Gammaproteobacteria bacterium]|nr:cell envelope integrity EipB family protein [Gammaproteobacteria bacterium]